MNDILANDIWCDIICENNINECIDSLFNRITKQKQTTVITNKRLKECMSSGLLCSSKT